MLNNKYILSNFNILKNKYFFVLCFYLRKNLNYNYIYNTLFIGYKYNYLLLNIKIFLKSLKHILFLIKNISKNNGNILIVHTNNNIINYLLQKNSLKNNIYYLSSFVEKQANLINYLDYFPDLVISFDYKTNAIFLNKISQYSVPVICLTNILNKNIILNQFYYLLLNNNSLYSNIILLYLFYNTISDNKKKLGSQFLYK